MMFMPRLYYRYQNPSTYILSFISLSSIITGKRYLYTVVCTGVLNTGYTGISFIHLTLLLVIASSFVK